jgi:hypothetical protein
MFTLPRPQALYFISGASALSDLRGLLRLSVPLGISIPELSEPALAVLLEHTCLPDLRVFVDSGAFSEVDRTGRVVHPIANEEWDRRVAVMLQIAIAFGARATIVAPDCVGNQVETLRRLSRYAVSMRTARAADSRIVVPIQRGERSPASFAAAAAEALGFDDFVAGIPGNKIAMPTAELEAYLRARRPRAVHLLGMGPRNARYQKLVDVVRRLAPGAEISCDSQAFTAKSGRTNGRDGEPRELTSWQDAMEGRPSAVMEATPPHLSEQPREDAVLMTFAPAALFWRFAEKHGHLIGVRLKDPSLQQGLFDDIESR